MAQIAKDKGHATWHIHFTLGKQSGLSSSIIGE